MVNRAVVLLSSQCFVKIIHSYYPAVTVEQDKSGKRCRPFHYYRLTTLLPMVPRIRPLFSLQIRLPDSVDLATGVGLLMGLTTNNSPRRHRYRFTNPAGTNYIEGLPVSADTQYGGSNDNDNSCSL